MKHYLIIFIAATCVGLSSCSIYSSYQAKTDKDVPETLYGDVQLGDSASSIGNVGWRELFSDPQLQALIDTCLARNVDMQTAYLHIDQANAGLTAARLSYLPSLAFTPNAAITKYGIYPESGKVYNLPFTAQWQLDAFGLLRNQHRQQKATRDMLQDVAQAVKTGLIGGVANTYYTLAMLDEQIRIAQETEQTWQQTVKSMQALMQAGMTNQAGVSQMEAAWHGVHTQLLSLQQSRNEVCNALSLLLDMPAGSHTQLAPSLSSFQSPAVLNVGVPCQLLHNRPDVRAAENQLRAACYANKAATSAFFPQLSLTGTFGWTNTDGAGIINPAFTIAQLVGALVQPIFAKGGLRAQKIAAKDELKIASLNFQHKLLEAGGEVNNYLDACQKAREKTTALQQQVDALQKALNATRLTMQYGNTTHLEVLTAQQSLLSAQLGQVANRFEEIQAVVNLYTALGGGRK